MILLLTHSHQHQHQHQHQRHHHHKLAEGHDEIPIKFKILPHSLISIINPTSTSQSSQSSQIENGNLKSTNSNSIRSFQPSLPTTILQTIPTPIQSPSTSKIIPITTITTSTNSPSSSISPISLINQTTNSPSFLSNLKASPGSIVFACLLGLAILSLTISILSFSLRRWCNRRKRKSLDENIWKFWDTPKQFSKNSNLLQTHSISISNSQNNFQNNQNLSSIPQNLSPTYPFTSHIHHQNHHSSNQNHHSSNQNHHSSNQNHHSIQSLTSDYQNLSKNHHFLSIRSNSSIQSNHLLDQSNLTWSTSPIPQSSHSSSVLLAPFIHSNTLNQSQSQIPHSIPTSPSNNHQPFPIWLSITTPLLSTPDLAYLPPLEKARINSCPIYTSSQNDIEKSSILPQPKLVLDTNLNHFNLSNYSPIKISRLPLSRNISIACSEQSTTLEVLRNHVAENNINTRASLFGAVQRQKEQDEIFLESYRALVLDSNLSPINDLKNYPDLLESPIDGKLIPIFLVNTTQIKSLDSIKSSQTTTQTKLHSFNNSFDFHKENLQTNQEKDKIISAELMSLNKSQESVYSLEPLTI